MKLFTQPRSHKIFEPKKKNMISRALSIGGRNWFVCLQVLLILVLFKFTLSTLENQMQNNSKRQCITGSNSQSLLALIPKRIQLNNSETYRLVEEESNLAISYWAKWNMFKSKENMLNMKADINYCENVVLTSPDKLKLNNLYWQQFDALPNETHPNETTILNMYLYNAYYDNREAGKPVVRLITTNNHELAAIQRKWYCLLWFDLIKQPILVPISDYYNVWPSKMWRKSANYSSFHPQLISCPIPEVYANDIPRAVSLQSRASCATVQHEPSNVLRVKYQHKRRPDKFRTKSSIGVCVRTLHFGTNDMSVRLVEWLEMVRLLGADQVYLYVLGLTENIRKVLQHYKKEGFVQWRETSLPGAQANINSYYNLLVNESRDYFRPTETLELNDCLYRSLYRHDYIALIDIDEVIVPQNHLNWHQLIKSMEDILPESYLDKIAYYNILQSDISDSNPESTHMNVTIPEYLYMMRHTFRAPAQSSAHGSKSIFRTDLVTSVRIPFPVQCFNTIGRFNCSGITVDPTDALLMRYGRNEANVVDPKNVNQVSAIHNRKMWRYYDSIDKSVCDHLEKIFS